MHFGGIIFGNILKGWNYEGVSWLPHVIWCYWNNLSWSNSSSVKFEEKYIQMDDTGAPVFWSSDVNRRLTGKVPDAGKDWGQKEKRVSEDELSGWHHQCNKHELGSTWGDGEGQEGLVCCSPWGHKESDTIGQLNNTLGVESKERWFSHLLWCWPTDISPRWTHGVSFPVLLRSIVTAGSRWAWQLRAEALKSD